MKINSPLGIKKDLKNLFFVEKMFFDEVFRTKKETFSNKIFLKTNWHNKKFESGLFCLQILNNFQTLIVFCFFFLS